MSNKKPHDCAVLIDRFEELVRQHERVVVGAASRSHMGWKTVEEMLALRHELKTLLSLACSADFGEGDAGGTQP